MSIIRRARHAAFAVFLILWCALSYAASDQAVVRKLGDIPLEIGQAFVAHYGDRCIALLPSHVVAEADAPSLRYVGTAQPNLGNLVDVIALGDDLSLGTIVGGISRDCGHHLGSFSRAVDARLSESTQGALRFVNGDGSLGFEPVVWLDDDRREFIRVRPTSTQGVLRKGMSGSLLMAADNTPIGMLLSVSTNSGVGTVMRMDRMLERAEAALAERGTKTFGVDGEPAARLSTEDAQKLLTLSAWSAPAASSEHQAENLLAIEPRSKPWLTASLSGPVTLDFRVEAGTVINGLSIDATSIDEALRPRAAELILASDDEFHSARSVWGGNLTFSPDDRIELRFAPTRPRVVRLVLYPKTEEGVSLKSIKALH
ncbi:hypothetical protein SAOR_13430 [Salinisphaera orenii MK-B5]|uniref:Uncharacterized protein n=1 Tax=Salinisphaera orenii MK-B5 TaxID=856730 RepID=A0A423PHM1_9GAMM|nr:hypothetical protein [Salinisphaera orenii]ROO25055.1 hypothetical protein SAOR_13430 [Salinisphaera orenii MK-B5]